MGRKILVCGLLALTAACGREEQQPAERSSGTEATATDTSRPVVLFLGTSLTAGMGLSSAQAFPALIQAKIDSLGLGFRVVNAGNSGECQYRYEVSVFAHLEIFRREISDRVALVVVGRDQHRHSRDLDPRSRHRCARGGEGHAVLRRSGRHEAL